MGQVSVFASVSVFVFWSVFIKVSSVFRIGFLKISDIGLVFWLTDPGLLQSRMLRSQNVWSYHAASTQVTNVKPAFYIGGKEIEYVDSWPHLGNLVHTRPSCNDRHDIVSKKNSLCVQINNVLCYFGRRDPITKLWWMRTYCSSFYGSVLWDLTNPSVEEVCAMLRKGL